MLKHSKFNAPFSNSPNVFVKQPSTYSGLSVTQNWKQPLSERAFEDDPGAEYVAMALIWPLQHVSRMDELEPPTGTAHAARLVGGAGIGNDAVQDILIGACVLMVVFQRQLRLGSQMILVLTDSLRLFGSTEL
jgi:hypothetical protein